MVFPCENLLKEFGMFSLFKVDIIALFNYLWDYYVEELLDLAFVVP